VTFRFPSPDMEARFKFQPNGKALRGREQAQHDMREWWRHDVLIPAARFCWHAQQPEYQQLEGMMPDEFWKKSKRICDHATRDCWVYFDGGFVTVQMEIFAHAIPIYARKEMQHLTGAIEAALMLEIGVIEADMARPLPEGAEPDKFQNWRLRVYKDIRSGLMDDFFMDDRLSILPSDQVHILGKEPK
jgi:hypothetical protein